MSVRGLARKYHVHRRLVREALMHAELSPRKAPERKSPQLEPLKEIIDGWLRDDLDAPRKQRRSVKRVHARLLDEHGADVSYSAVRDSVSRRRPEIWEEAGRGPARAFVPQHHPPGQDAEVDFGELWVRLAGVMTKCYLFVLRLSYSGKAVHQVFATCGQEAFLEGHVHAFDVLGGVPAGMVRYDNIKAAVWKVLVRGRAREENPRWTAFRSHYRMFEPFYCFPGIEGAHEKGGVEGEVGYFRRNYLSPVPEVASVGELNARIAVAGETENGRRIGAPVPDDRPRPRGREAAAGAAARGSVRDRPGPVPAGRPLFAGDGPVLPLLGPGPDDRPAGPGRAALLRAHGLRQEDRGRTASPADRQGLRVPRARSLPGGTHAQARDHARIRRPGPGPRLRGVHRRPRRPVVRGPAGPSGSRPRPGS
jgi:transposase